MASPSQDDKDELLLSCRYGEIDEVQQYLSRFGSSSLSDVRDENGNSILHMICGNGHLDILQLILPLIPPTLLSIPNSSQSTPLHWAAMNSHLKVAKALIEFPKGPGIDLIDLKNAAGRSPLGEAEMAGWDEGAKFFVSMMRLDDGGTKESEADDTAEGMEVEVEIQDADGGVARMNLGNKTGTNSSKTVSSADIAQPP